MKKVIPFLRKFLKFEVFYTIECFVRVMAEDQLDRARIGDVA